METEKTEKTQMLMKRMTVMVMTMYIIMEMLERGKKRRGR